MPTNKNSVGASDVNRKSVTIFGAGIAGLTAAHELVERGFLVQVVEPRESLNEEGCCEVGGLAATQWSFLSDPDLSYEKPWSIKQYSSSSGGEPPPVPKLVELPSAPYLPYRIYFRVRKVRKIPTPCAYSGTYALGDVLDPPPQGKERIENLTNDERLTLLANALVKFIKSLGKKSNPKIYVVGHAERSASEAEARIWALRWARKVARLLRPMVAAKLNPSIYPAKLVPLSMGSGDPIGDNRFSEGRLRNNRVELHVAGAWVPGDHGYRFFPSFYRNLDDTMKRTPLYDFRGDETGEGALSRLKGTSEVSIAMATADSPLRFPRRRAKSFEELRAVICEVFEKLGYTGKDLALFQLQLFRFLTMSPRRRRSELDGNSWLDFVRGIDRITSPGRGAPCSRCGRTHRHDHRLPFSDGFLRDIEKLPQAMSGMRAKESDAHTNGTITLQILLDQLGDSAGTDRLLDGPTSTSWLSHWKSYLCRQGVRFFVGRLKGLQLRVELTPTPGFPPVPVPSLYLDPVVVGRRAGLDLIDVQAGRAIDLPPVAEPGFADEVAQGLRPSGSSSFTYRSPSDYYVAAIPINHLKNLLKNVPLPSLPSPFQEIREFRLGRAFSRKRDKPLGVRIPFRDVTGIQFYFANDFHFAEGHTYHADSAWRLTSISQLQFWRQRLTTKSGYLGILSVDIGEMHKGDCSLCTKSVFEFRISLEDLERQLTQNPNAQVQRVFHCLVKTDRFLEELEVSFRDWTAKLRSTQTQFPWEITAILGVNVRASKQALVNGGLNTVLDKLRTFNAPTPEEIRWLKRALSSVASSPPSQLSDRVGQAWARTALSLKDLLDTLDPTGIEDKARPALSGLERAVACLESLATVPFAWQSTRDQIAKSAWRQIEITLQKHSRGSVPEPNFYHIDEGIVFGRRNARGERVPDRNKTPFFINTVDGFDARPGVLPDADKNTPFYKIAFGQWLPVGGAMKSHTRITSMEHANESGRHAVRAILHDLVTRPNGTMYGTFPRYWNPEDYELADLDFLRRVDEILHEDKHPHMTDILGLEEAVVRWVAGPGCESPDNLGALLGAVRNRGDKDFAPWIDAMEPGNDPLRKFAELLKQIGMRFSVR